MVRLRRREMVPLVGSSSPARSLHSVDLPPPFSPTSPMRSPSIISASISQKMGFPPKSLLTFERFTSNIICALLFRVSRYQRYSQRPRKPRLFRAGMNGPSLFGVGDEGYRLGHPTLRRHRPTAG